jgi:uncharacterized protein involved in response to NO
MLLKSLTQKLDSQPVFFLGFRCFFLGAAIFAVLSIFQWALVFRAVVPLPLAHISPSQWHAHEMIYGYAFAVVAGFLLTAVKTWTGLPVVTGWRLAALFALWAISRIFFILGNPYILFAAFTEIAFMIGLLISVTKPIIKAKQHRQFAIVGKVLIWIFFNAGFYLTAWGYLDNGIYWSIYGGLYLLIGLVLTMGRRVIPFFIERGVGYTVSLRNSKTIDIASLVLFLGFFVSELFLQNQLAATIFALPLFAVNGYRLLGWHTHGIWQKSLLWSLYLSFWLVSLGFLVYAADYWLGYGRSASIHCFAYGGVGMITLAMMSRVSLGHTGRTVAKPPKLIGAVFGILFLGFLCRVIMPILLPQLYLQWILLAQILWISAFIVFLALYLPMLIKPRIDGAEG